VGVRTGYGKKDRPALRAQYKLKGRQLDRETNMVIHTFAFRWKGEVTEEQKARVMAEIRELQGQIPGLLETWVGMNFSPRSQGYALGGVMKFADRAALEAYDGHPVHQKLLRWLMPLIEPVEVDFEG
jgi:Stress responsive A/B Barrel Domain